MGRTVLNPPDLFDPLPWGFSQVVRVGETVYVSGQVAMDREGKVVGEDITAQAEQAFRNLGAALHAAGADFKDVVKMNTYLVRPEDVAGFRAVRARYFPTEPPASTLVIVSRLVHPDLLVEVEAVAVVGAGG